MVTQDNVPRKISFVFENEIKFFQRKEKFKDLESFKPALQMIHKDVLLTKKRCYH